MLDDVRVTNQLVNVFNFNFSLFYFTYNIIENFVLFLFFLENEEDCKSLSRKPIPKKVDSTTEAETQTKVGNFYLQQFFI